MMLVPTEEQRMLDSMVRRVLENGSPYDPHSRDGRLRPDAWASFAELGLLGIGLPAEYGGLGSGGDDADKIAIVARAMGEALSVEPFIETVAQCGAIIAGLGAEAQTSSLLPAIASGDLRMALIQGQIAMATGQDELLVNGTAALVPAGGWADRFLIAVKLASGSTAILVAAADTPGLSVDPVLTVDGRMAADIVLRNIRLDPDALLGEGTSADQALEQAGEMAAMAAACMAAGSIAALARLTLAHVTVREQFGQPLGAFQTIHHRVARMCVLAQEASAAALFAQVEQRAGGDRRRRATSSAMIRIAAIADTVAREAVQLHGAIGLTDEYQVSAHYKALFAFARSHGGVARHQRRLAALLRAPGLAAAPLAADSASGMADGDGMSLSLSAADEAFRVEVAGFLASALDESIVRGGRLNVGIFAEPDIARPWHQTLYRQGWVAPYLPKEVGGTGWTPLQAYLFEAEYGRAGAPPLQLQGMRMLAPVLMRYGTDAQKAHYLPAILSGEHVWCQGYSEPGAGSDLAALRTSAVVDGDDYVVNGSKIWTTQAQHATHMFALVRTSSGGRKQDGISFLLIDMRQPGISIRPIRTMAGDEEVNEVFFNDVRVPRENLVGVQDEGWACAKYLLEFERGGSTVSGGLRAYFARALDLGPALDLEARIAALGAEIDAIEMAELQGIALTEAGDGQEPLSASALKLRMAEIRQAVGALAADILGQDALRWVAERPLHHAPPQDAAAERRRATVPNAFNDLAYSIFAGSSEVQLSILARGIGLPPRKN